MSQSGMTDVGKVLELLYDRREGFFPLDELASAIASGRTGVDAAITSSVTLWGGRLIHNSTGTIASAIIQGGELDVSRGGLNVIISSLKLNEGSFIYDPESVTVSSIVEADYPVHWSSVKGT